MPAKKSVNSAVIKEDDNSKQTMSLEEAFAELDELIRHMDDEKISLEDSFNSYKKGLELIKMCNDSIGDIEGKLEILESGDNEE